MSLFRSYHSLHSGLSFWVWNIYKKDRCYKAHLVDYNPEFTQIFKELKPGWSEKTFSRTADAHTAIWSLMKQRAGTLHLGRWDRARKGNYLPPWSWCTALSLINLPQLLLTCTLFCSCPEHMNRTPRQQAQQEPASLGTRTLCRAVRGLRHWQLQGTKDRNLAAQPEQITSPGDRDRLQQISWEQAFNEQAPSSCTKKQSLYHLL